MSSQTQSPCPECGESLYVIEDERIACLSCGGVFDLHLLTLTLGQFDSRVAVFLDVEGPESVEIYNDLPAGIPQLLFAVQTGSYRVVSRSLSAMPFATFSWGGEIYQTTHVHVPQFIGHVL